LGSTTKLIPYPEPTDLASAGADAIKALATDLDFTKIVLTSADTLNAAALIGSYPMGASTMTMSSTQASAGGWPLAASASVWTFRPGSGIGVQYFYENNYNNQRIYYRVMGTANGTWWLMGGTDTGWLAITGLSGWSVSGGIAWQARQIGNHVWLRGGMNNSAFTGGYTTVGQLPTAIANPPSTHVIPCMNNTALARAVLISNAGAVQAYAEAASSSGFYISSSNYRID
jgi:hypothetical protein